jgi:hypothetical protein
VSYKKSLILALLLVFGVILYFFKPEDTVWLPKCPVHILTGYQCPSCGGQRAMYQLLHGNFYEAISFNAFLLISMPYAISLALVTWFIPKHRCVKLRKFCYHRATALTYVVLMVIWWVVRNILGI